ncbi:universal stress protein [Streptomyces sp. NPDC026672]|uniref:universal stress protein n=1 Tax=Actinomycetes TaxID=1760 RepID=UPI0033E2070D
MHGRGDAEGAARRARGPQVVEGHPAAALTEAAKDAELLVVGSRGHGAFTGMLLGSVSHHCVHHATCPVLVVRADTDRTART